MAPTFALTLDGVSETLISGHSAITLRTLAEKLPATFLRFLFAFECRLDESSNVDFIVGLTKDYDNTTDIIGELLSNPLFCTHVRSSVEWNQVKALLLAYREPKKPLHRGLENIFLEFDSDTFTAPHPIPGVFTGLRPNSHQGTTISEAYKALFTAVGFLLPNEFLEEQRSVIQRCLRCLPAHSHVFNVGAMLQRPGSKLRLCVMRITLDEILAFLRGMGCSQGYDRVEHVRQHYGAIFDRFVLSFDVTNRIEPNMGIECFFEKKRQPRNEPRWEQALGQLVAHNLCSSAKAQALLGFPKQEVYYPLLSSEHRQTYYMNRGLHHVKVTAKDQGLSAKAYLHAWVKPVD